MLNLTSGYTNMWMYGFMGVWLHDLHVPGNQGHGWTSIWIDGCASPKLCLMASFYVHIYTHAFKVYASAFISMHEYMRKSNSALVRLQFLVCI